MIVYFNDNCQAGINSRIRCCSFFPDEIRQIKIHLEKLPVHTELIENFSLVYVKFNDSADEAYFRLLTSNGIEI